MTTNLKLDLCSNKDNLIVNIDEGHLLLNIVREEKGYRIEAYNRFGDSLGNEIKIFDDDLDEIKNI